MWMKGGENPDIYCMTSFCSDEPAVSIDILYRKACRGWLTPMCDCSIASYCCIEVMTALAS